MRNWGGKHYSAHWDTFCAFLMRVAVLVNPLIIIAHDMATIMGEC